MEADARYQYERIADDIAQQVADGRLQPGARLPNRDELAAQYGVSHKTSGRAVRLLAERGIVAVRKTGTIILGTPQPAPEPAGDEIEQPEE